MPARTAVIAFLLVAACAGQQKDHVKESRVALSERRVDDAVQHGELALRDLPGSRDGRIVLAAALRAKADTLSVSDPEGELELRVRAAETEPRRTIRANDYARVSGLARELDKIDVALDALDQSLKADPTNLEVRRVAAQWADEEGDLERATRHYLWLWDVHPEDTNLGLRLGNLYLQLKQFDDAEAIFGRIIAAGPENVQASLGRAEALEAMGRPRHAEDIYRELVNRHDDNAGLYFRYAQFLERQGRERDAAKWQKAGEKVLPGVKRRRMRKLR